MDKCFTCRGIDCVLMDENGNSPCGINPKETYAVGVSLASSEDTTPSVSLDLADDSIKVHKAEDIK